jgi:peptidyl-prolyl cis-trans isomerase B (cyclophilin B)
MSEQQWSEPPTMQIDQAKDYLARIETAKGTIEIQLNAEHAPLTVNNFVFLAREGYYEGTTFHRVIPDFMVQAGDPTGTGRGGPGYQFADETNGNPLRHETGVISMANPGVPDANGSQFFITHSPQQHLDGKHTVFGSVTEGQSVVDALLQGDQLISVSITEND